MSNNEEIKLVLSQSSRTTVRFTESEYRQIVNAVIESGKSVPWLLKTAFFKKGISAPTLDVERRKTVLRELSHIGNNINQIAKTAHIRGFECIKSELLDGLRDIRLLKSFLGLAYGDR